MAPTFGVFDFVPDSSTRNSTVEIERDAYLAEVQAFSTEFGVRSESENRIHDRARLGMAMLLNRF